MNKLPFKNVEVRLGGFELLAVLGALAGLVFGTFYLGYWTGNYVGFDRGRAANTGELVPLPAALLDSEPPSNDNDESALAALNEPAKMMNEEASNEAQSAPKDGKKTAPVVEVAEQALPEPKKEGMPLKSLIESEFADAAEGDSPDSARPADSSEPDAVVRVLGQDKKTSEKTLRDLLDEREHGKGGAESNEAKAKASVPMLTDKLPDVVEPTASPDKKIEAVPAKVADKKEVPKLDDGKKGEPKPKATSPSHAKVVVKAEPSAVPAVKSQTVKTVPTGWYAQVAAPKKLAEAEAMRGRLQKAGFPAVIERAEIRGESYYRVVVGPEDNRVQVDRLIGQLRRESFVAGEPFVRRVK